MIEKLSIEDDLELNNKAIKNELLLANWFLDGMEYNKKKEIFLLNKKFILSKYDYNTLTVYNSDIIKYNDEYTLIKDINKIFNEFTETKHLFFNLGNGNILNENLEYISNNYKISNCPYMESFYIDRNVREYNVKYLKKHSIYKLSEFLEYRKIDSKEDIEKIYKKWCKIKSLKNDDVLGFSKRFVNNIIKNNSKYDIYGLYFEDEILGLHILKKYNNCMYIYVENVIDELGEDFTNISNKIYEKYNKKYPTEYKIIYNKLRNSLKRIMLHYMMKTYNNIRYFNIDCVGDKKDKTLYNYKKIYYGSCNKVIKITKKKISQ